MAVDEQNELPKATPREAELQRQLDGIQSQVTELNRARIEVAENPEFSSKVHSLKENLDEHSKQLEQSTEKLSQLESENLNLQDENQASIRQAKGANDVEDNESEPEPDKEALEGAEKTESPMVAYLEQMFSKRLDAMQSMVERLPGVAPPIRKSNPDSYADTPFTDEITLIEMSRKFSFPNIKAYDGTSGLDDHVAQYRQRMLAIALPKESREATMCKGFGSTLTGSALQWYINLPSRSIASFAILSDKFVEQFASSRDLEKTSDGQYEILQHRAEPLRSYIARFNQEKVAIPEGSIPTAISAFKRGLLPDGDLYKELTKYQCKTMEDVLSRAWAQIKWEEDVASRAKAQLKQDPKAVRPDRTDRDEKPSSRPARDSGNRNRSRNQNRPIEKAEGMTMSTWPDISHLSVSRPELINVLRQMGQQDKWPQKMKAPDSFRNPGLWCDFHHNHSHKTEDCVALKIEDRVIHVISSGSEISSISHAATKKSTWNAKHGLEAAKPKRLLLGTYKISFTAKEQERILTPHHDALVISLTVVNCLVKRILVDNGSSSNIIFQAAYKDLGLEESALTQRITPLIRFSGEVKQTAGKATLKGKTKVL
ncbi:hypothetical protein DY000_02053079 [Brassica cretica]|uniref:Retrotransposon gag domain-containing protein n=1 Tax=Brassica cretica TaxID=69181 RepID=A0ABQ7AK25_BRACR|nr:hypothetical protein DY000_02053079 [Brassica cretica]